MASQTYEAVKRDLNADNKPLQIAGTTYAGGLGTFAVSEVPVTVPEGTTGFSGKVGVDDSDKEGNVRFRILSGNAVLWESPDVKAGDAAVQPRPARRSLVRRHVDHARRCRRPECVAWSTSARSDRTRPRHRRGNRASTRRRRVFGHIEVVDDRIWLKKSGTEIIRQAAETIEAA